MSNTEPIPGSQDAADLSAATAARTAAAPVSWAAVKLNACKAVIPGMVAWCRRLGGDLRHSTPHEQLAILYYGFGVLAVVGAISGFVYKHLWVEKAEASPISGPLYSCIAKDNPREQVQTILNRLGDAILQLAEQKNRQPNRSAEIEEAIQELMKCQPKRAIKLLEEFAAAGQTSSKRPLAAAIFLEDKATALAKLKKAADEDPKNYDVWFDLGNFAHVAGNLEIAEAAFDQAVNLARAQSHALREAVSLMAYGDVLLVLKGLTKATIAWKLADEICKKHTDSKNAEWQGVLAQSLIRKGDELRENVDPRHALEAYQKARDIIAKLAADHPKTIEWQRHLVEAHLRVGHVLKDDEKYDGALEAYNKAFQIATGQLQTAYALAQEGEVVQDSHWQQYLSISHNAIADVLVLQDKRDDALVAYQQGCAIAKRLVEDDESNMPWQRELMLCTIRIGEILSVKPERKGAQEAISEGHDRAEKIAEKDSSNTRSARDRAFSIRKQGDFLLGSNDRDQALKYHLQALDIVTRLAARDRGNATLQREEWAQHNRVGDILREKGDSDRAIDEYRAGLQISKRVAERYPKNAQWLRDQVVNQNKIGDMLADQKKLLDALGYYKGSLENRSKLVGMDNDPANAKLQRDLIVNHNKVAETLLALQKRDEAINDFRKSQDILRKLVEHHPTNAQWQCELAVGYNKIGDLRKVTDPDGAIADYRDGQGVLSELAKRDQSNAQWQADLVLCYRKLADMGIEPPASFQAIVRSLEVSRSANR